MKKVTFSQTLILLGLLGLANQVKAQIQTEAIPVPTYNNRSEMPARLSPEQKMLRQLPKVVIKEDGIDQSMFVTEMNLWLTKNAALLPQFEKHVAELINQRKFEDLSQILIEMEHTKEIAGLSKKGGSHE